MSSSDLQPRSRDWSLLLGAALVALGILLLLGQVLNVDLAEFGWPFFVIAPGVLLLLLAFALRGRSGAWLVFPGSIVTVTGLLLLYQNTTRHWESWAYAWALVFPASIGIGQIVYGWLTRRHGAMAAGARLSAWGIALFLLGAVFFETVIGISGRDFGQAGRIALPALLIAIGLLFLLAEALPGWRRST